MSDFTYKQIFMIGIGGIGMSALAKWFLKNNIKVYGYDRTESKITDELMSLGAKITFQDAVAELPVFWRTPGQDKMAVYTSAVVNNSKLLNHFMENGFTVKKRAELLGILTHGKKTIAVSGTHGKTSATALITHILKIASVDCNAFIGGITKDYKTNAVFGNGDTYVVEADEFDRSFLQLFPDYIILTAMDADHLDIYGSFGNMQQAYKTFLGQLKEGGTIIKKEGLLEDVKGYTYALNSDTSDIKISNIQLFNDHSKFDYYFGLHILKNVVLNIPGLHNIENAAAAISLALCLGVQYENIRRALFTYQGIERRFEYKVKNGHAIYIDDYAHHPKELEVLIHSVKEVFKDKKLTLVFQPHLFSRTKDFADDFAAILSKVDTLILLEIYPAREKPIEGIHSTFLLDKIKHKDKHLLSKEELLDYVSEHKPPLLVTAGAGDIDRLVHPIQCIYETDMIKIKHTGE